MKKKYLPRDFEKKWLAIWEKEGIYKFQYDRKKKKYYILVELPYTSGNLHIGHWFTFTAPDVLARYKRMTGYNVFFPIGYDAFGLPAENAAIKQKVHPQDWTMKNIETMNNQFQQMGSMINNWDRVVVTCLPEYYGFNQYIFLKMYEKGLVYRGKALSNWCPSCQTVLANENVVDGKCWRCDSQVEQKEIPQWFIKITDYGERLLWPEKPTVDWPQSVREGQNNWIGRSEGTEIEFSIYNSQFSKKIKVFTTRVDTFFGISALAIAPEHWLIKEIQDSNSPWHKKISKEKLAVISDYVENAKRKLEEERLAQVKEKTGVDTTLKAIHPLTGEEIPIWVADYVLGWYGEGAVMVVPAHDERDYQFAQKFNLPIKKVVLPDKSLDFKAKNENGVFTDYGVLVNSGEFNGLRSQEAIEKITKKLQSLNLGKKKIVYHLRDWSISRQRYWGTPVPMIHCPNCGIVPVSYDDLPIELPYEVDFTPKGKPPLATNKQWLKTKCPRCHQLAFRDSETLDTFFDSSWYWYRYVSPDYKKGPFDQELVKKLTPVDIYFGGAEHTLGHTLYARFFTKFFHDLGWVDYDEFALKRVQHGIVLGPDGAKMSKSKGNVINPDEQVNEYGADAVRMYLCFMMPYEGTGPWSDKAMAGVYRFLKRVWDIYQIQYSDISSQNKQVAVKFQEDKNLVVKLNRTIRKVSHDIEKIKMNTAVAAMMEFLNEWESKIKNEQNLKMGLSVENAKKFLQILAPFAPFLSEEIWREVFEEKTSIHLSKWPEAEEIDEEEVVIPVQVNGKLRATIKVKRGTSNVEREIEKIALDNEKVRKYLEGRKYKMIYVERKVVNFVLL